MRTSRWLSLLTVVSLLCLGLVLTPKADAQQTPVFGSPIISGIQGVGFEQDDRVDKDGNIYTSAPGTLSANTSWIWHSTDGGKTFELVPDSKPQTGKATTCSGGGDTELATDSTGSVYFADLTLANFSTARSDDHGSNFTCSNTGVPDTIVDRQWYAVDGDPKAGGAIYLASDEIGPGAPVCGSSQGNNVLVMYKSPTVLDPTGQFAGIEFGPANKVSGVGTCNEGIMGNNEVSPVATTTGHPGGPALATAVKHIYVIHDNATFDQILIGRCYPDATDPSGMSCDDLPVANLGANRTGGNFPTMAIDGAGNLYTVWEQAPYDANTDKVTGDSVLMYSFSTDEGAHWSTPTQISPPSLHNNVFAWIAAGDDGRVDIAWYGTPDVAKPDDPNCGTDPNGADGTGGPDAVTNGLWSLYFTQSLDAHAANPTFSAPVVASGHYVHKGTIQTLIGHQCGDRTLGDFLQMRIGKLGEAVIAYADSNNQDEFFAPHGMVVRQTGGDSVFAANSPLNIQGLQESGSVTDPQGDGTYDYGGQTSANMPNLDVTGSTMTLPAAKDCAGAKPCYEVTMQLNNLSLDPPAAPDTDTTLVWMTQWLVPADPACTSGGACLNGGTNFMVYGESQGGGDITCWDGQNSAQALGGGVTLTYPGLNELMGNACKSTLGANGTITIDVPIDDVTMHDDSDPPKAVPPLDGSLYSVTASTITMQGAAEDPSCSAFGFLCGRLFNLIDEAQGYTFTPTGADVSVTLQDSADPVAKGGQLTYTAIVTNNGPFDADGVQLTDQLPASTSFVSANPSAGNCTGTQTVTCDLGTVGNGQSVTVGIVVHAPGTPTSIDDSVSVTSTTPDPDPSNNAASQTTAVGCTVTGSANRDVLSGTPKADIICGLGGNDVLRGLGGNDVLVGGDGNDKLLGGAGRDRLFGDAGNDTLLPGAGGDSVVQGGDGSDTVEYGDAPTGVTVNLATQKVTGGSGSDHLADVENAAGSNHDDVVRGGGGRNALSGRDGADRLLGEGGNDTLRGGLGPDHLDGGAGQDLATYPITPSAVSVNLGTGRARGGGGADRLTAVEGVSGSQAGDHLIGNAGKNVLLGGGGNDTLEGEGGNDKLDGGAGRDSLDGGPGTDQCVNGEKDKSCELPPAGGPRADAAEEAAALGLTPSQADSLFFTLADGSFRLGAALRQARPGAVGGVWTRFNGTETKAQ